MEVGMIRRIDIDLEMQQAYLDYAMSVIVARALPDARDGLKPVQRRILFAMHEMGLGPETAYKKSARIVGEVLGKYHPHGDMAVYEAMARMGQEFSMRCRLVDGQGNFGSIDGDAPAAMRYTEARLSRPASELLADIEKETCDFVQNFDDSLREPVVLPSALPNLLANGATGIAVGMATSIPPHNLGEICDALVHLLESWNRLDHVSVQELMRFVKGPDFPTGGLVVREGAAEEGLSAAYGTGRGRITVQARVHLEEGERGRKRVIITEVPFQVNKSALLERIAELARDGSLEGLADLRDESDRQGMRVVIELARTADPDTVVRELYHRTPLQVTFSINMLALVNGEPRLLSLKQALKVYLDHRLEVVRRRSEHDLRRARERAHILEGYRVALNRLDAVIRLIRQAKEPEEASQKLQVRFKLTRLQAEAILDMPLKRLAALERKKIEIEYKEKLALIKHLTALLESPRKMRALVSEDLKTVKSSYGDRRRTQIVTLADATRKRMALTAGDLIPDEAVWVTLTRTGRLARISSRRLPRLAGQELSAVLQAGTHDILYLINERGQASSLAVYSIPEREQAVDGAPFSSLSALEGRTPVTALAVAPAGLTQGVERLEETGGYLFLGSVQGMVKRIPLADLPGPSSRAYNVMSLGPGDRLGWARLTTGSEEILLVTEGGMGIRFSEGEVRPMGLSAAGVLGIKLGGDQERVVALEVMRPRQDVFLLTAAGEARRTPTSQFPTQRRYGAGVNVWKRGRKQVNPRVAGAATGGAGDWLLIHTTREAGRLIKFEAAPRQGRPGRGKRLLELRKEEAVSGLVSPSARFEPEGLP